MIRLVTDTTAVLPREFAARNDLVVIPQIIRFGNDSYMEGIEMDEPEFLRRLVASPVLPGTAAPPPGLFDEMFRRAAETGDTVIAIHPSSDVSGTVPSAFTAKSLYPEADIRIVDMRTVGGCLAQAVRLAVEWRDAGQTADRIVADLTALIPRARTYFVVATLEYLHKNGRIGGASKLLGSMLQIKPLLHIVNGRVEAFDKVRTHHKALERLKDVVFAECPRSPESRLCVMHADAPTEANQLRDDLCAELGVCDIPLYSMGPAITTHAGPGTLAVGFYTTA
jgi:DegV family protein with EDD domain